MKRNQINRKHYLNKLIGKFRKVFSHIEFLKKSDEFDNMSNFEKKLLLQKMTKLMEKLKKYGKYFGLKLAGSALALFLMTTPLKAQNFDYFGVTKSPVNKPLKVVTPVTSIVVNNSDTLFYIVNYYGQISVFQKHSDYLDAKGILFFKTAEQNIYLSNLAPYTIDFTDIDNDGDKDLFLGEKNGHIYEYENDNGFDLCDTVTVDGTKNLGNNLKFSFADFNNDGNEDLFYGIDNTNPGKNEKIIYAQNNGNEEFANASGLVNPGNNILNLNNPAPSLFDFNSDGNMDLMIGTTDGYVVYYQNNGSGKFERTDTLQADGADIFRNNNAFPYWFDYDKDGTKDLILSADDNIYLYKNLGASMSFVDTLNSNQLTTQEANGDIDVLDYDNDGDLDFLISKKSISFYKNNGDHTFSFDKYLKADGSDIQMGSDLYPCFFDVDGDGDKDIVVGNGTSLYLYTKIATGYTSSGKISDDFGEISISTPKPVFESLDGNAPKLYVAGDDYFVHSFTNNNGTFTRSDTLTFANGDTISANRIAFSDINNDNIDDLIYSSDGEYFYTAINDGQGNLTAYDSISVNNVPYRFSANLRYTFADMDNDGTDELFLSNDFKVDYFKSQYALGLKKIIPAIGKFSKIYSNKNSIYVELVNVNSARIEIFDVSGRRILSNNINESKRRFCGFEKGLYLVKIYSEKGINTAKVIVE